MKCPTCQTWTRVLATRGDRRRRECANEHKFYTQERLIPTPKQGGGRKSPKELP